MSDSGLWDSFWGEKDRSVDSWAKRRMINILDRYARPDMRVLDAGCGSGFFSSYLISRGCRVYSMDYSEEALSIARRITQNKARAYIKADILRAALDVKFDVIFTDGLLEHYSADEQDRIIVNMKTMKEDNGYLINFAPNALSLWSLVRPFCMRIKEKPFLMSDFLDLNARNGLNVVSSGGINVLPFRVSPERLLGRYFGMLFFCVAL